MTWFDDERAKIVERRFDLPDEIIIALCLLARNGLWRRGLTDAEQHAVGVLRHYIPLNLDA